MSRINEMFKNFYKVGLVVLLTIFLLIIFYEILNLDTRKYLAEHYISEGVQETGSINLVTSVLYDYRSFDTLGEATVILAASTILTFLVSLRKVAILNTKFTIIVYQTLIFILPFLAVLGGYLIFFSHLSPGGGFVGGVVLALIPILVTITYGFECSEYKLTPYSKSLLEDIGAIGFILLGLLGIFIGSNFLSSGQANLGLGNPGELISAGLIPYLNLMIGIKHKYFTFTYLMTAGIAGMVLTTDLFNLYVFLEVSSLSSCALVALKKTDKGIEGAFKELIMTIFGSFFILLATIITYYLTRTLNMAEIALGFKDIPFMIKSMLMSFFIFGYVVKIGLAPLHAWLPDAYEDSPIPYNVLSSGLVMKSAVYALIRVLYIIFGIEFLTISGFLKIGVFWGVITFITAHFLAYQQSNLSRLLAYSSIAQIGYITIGLFVGSEGGIISGNFHILNHTIMNGKLNKYLLWATTTLIILLLLSVF